MNDKKQRLLCVLAHPDDETLGCGGTLAYYAAQGIETYVITATRGQRGWLGDAQDYPGQEKLGQIREKELQAAAKALNITELTLLDCMDGDLYQADSNQVIGELAAHIRRIRPQVVITFDPFGAYGHPDHIAICQYTATAIQCAANTDYETHNHQTPFSVSKLYYLVATKATNDIYEDVFGELVMHIDGQERRSVSWADWSVSARIDISSYRQQIWHAVTCHKSQMRDFNKLLTLPDEVRETLWQYEMYFQVFSTVQTSSNNEDDLFAGLC